MGDQPAERVRVWVSWAPMVPGPDHENGGALVEKGTLVPVGKQAWAFGRNRTDRIGSSVPTEIRFLENRNRSVLFRDRNRGNSVSVLSVRFRF